MGSGTDIAKAFAPEHAALIENLKEQLLIVFVNRLGGEICIPVAEIDGTGEYAMNMTIDQKTRDFTFTTTKIRDLKFEPKVSGIVIEESALPIFRKHLSHAGYSFEKVQGPIPGTLALKVTSDNPVLLMKVIQDAKNESMRQKAN